MFSSTAFGLVAFSFVLLPGLVYYATVRRSQPLTRPIRDAADIVAWGIGFSVLAALIFASVRYAGVSFLAAPERVVGNDRADYLEENLARVSLSAVLVVALACVSAWIGARLLLLRRTSSSPRRRRGARLHLADVDPWWKVFQVEAAAYGRRHAVVELVDKSRVGGYVLWFSTEYSNYAERELVLAPWIDISITQLRSMAPTSVLNLDAIQRAHDFERVVVPASQVKMIWLRFVPEVVAATTCKLLDVWCADNGFERALDDRGVCYSDGSREIAVLQLATGDLTINIRTGWRPWRWAKRRDLARAARSTAHGKGHGRQVKIRCSALVVDGRWRQSIEAELLPAIVAFYS